MITDEIHHHPDAVRILQDLEGHASRGQQRFVALKGPVLADTTRGMP